MINPHKITDYNRTNDELEEFLLFCILVAGKTAYIQANKLELFLKEFSIYCENRSPFEIINNLKSKNLLLTAILKHKLGQYNKIFNAFSYLASCNIDLSQCTLDELESIPGVGPKTSRFFLLHSRKCEYAILDTHILKWFKSQGFLEAPKSTPSNKNIYKKWELLFINYCKNHGKDLAQFDLEIWNNYSKKDKTNDLKV